MPMPFRSQRCAADHPARHRLRRGRPRRACPGRSLVAAVWFDPRAVPADLLGSLDDSKRLAAPRSASACPSWCSPDRPRRLRRRLRRAYRPPRHPQRDAAGHAPGDPCGSAIDAPARIDGVDVPPGLARGTRQRWCRGDATVPQIAAASVVAKVCRDRLMVRLAAAAPALRVGDQRGIRHRCGIARRWTATGPRRTTGRSWSPVAQAELAGASSRTSETEANSHRAAGSAFPARQPHLPSMAYPGSAGTLRRCRQLRRRSCDRSPPPSSLAQPIKDAIASRVAWRCSTTRRAGSAGAAPRRRPVRPAVRGLAGPWRRDVDDGRRRRRAAAADAAPGRARGRLGPFELPQGHARPPAPHRPLHRADHLRRREEAEAAIARVRASTTGPRHAADGKPYHANDPALLAWVHVTEATSFLDGLGALRRAGHDAGRSGPLFRGDGPRGRRARRRPGRRTAGRRRARCCTPCGRTCCATSGPGRSPSWC